MQWEYALDAGSENMRLASRARADAFCESSFAAIRDQREAPFAWGDRALAIYGREPEGVRAVKPVSRGVPEDAALLAKWAKRLTEDSDKRLLRKSGLILGISSRVSEEAREALSKKLIDEGVSAVGYARADIACALGAGLDPTAPEACCIVDIGAEHAQASLISGGRTVREEHLEYGSNRIDEFIARRLREELGCAVGPRTAKEIKHELGAAAGASGRVKTEKAALDFASSLPRLREISAETILPCVRSVVGEIVELCAHAVRFVPVELAADLVSRGLVLVGGGCRLFGLDLLISDALSLPVKVAEFPEECQIRGLYKMLQSPKLYAPLVFDMMEDARHS